jgi:hypothetical protein
MRFVCLTFSEVVGATIRWDAGAPLTPEMFAAAVAAGFSEEEARSSPIGVLEYEFVISQYEVGRVGPYALVGTNGTTLIELR